jgi:DNA-binding FadR family transcriptional regulator
MLHADYERAHHMTDEGRRRASEPAVRPVRLVDHLVEQLQAKIAEGQYPAGVRLPSEAALATRYGVGRSTVREALRVLSHIGQVSTRTGSGSVVLDISAAPPLADAGMTIEEVSSIFTFRYSLEIPAVQIAAVRRTEEQMRTIKRRLRDIKEATRNRDVDTSCKADLSFHTAILEAAGYDFAARVYAEHRVRFEQAIKMLVVQGGPLEPGRTSDPVEALHDKLVECLKEKDARGAVRAVKRDQHEVDIRLDFARRSAKPFQPSSSTDDRLLAPSLPGEGRY